jgi:hypothetical protein
VLRGKFALLSFSSLRFYFDTHEVWPFYKFRPCCRPRNLNNFGPCADLGSLWLGTLRIRRFCFYHLRRVICWRTEQIKSTIKMGSSYDASNSGRDEVPIGPQPPTFETAPYRIFLAPAVLNRDRSVVRLSCQTECLWHIPPVLFLSLFLVIHLWS